MSNNLPAYIKKLTPMQQLTCEAMAANPNIGSNEVAKLVNISPETVRKYKRNPQFNEAVYNRFMEISGGRLVQVVDSMIREASEGNVQAATLILKHYGKLEDKITLRIESPFEKFLKIGNLEEAVVDEEVAKEISNEFIGVDLDQLPPRNPDNDRPLARKRKENKKLKEIKEESYKEEHRKKRRNEAYLLRRRAEAVGLKPLGNGRQRENVRKEWIRELRKREKLEKSK